MYHRGIKWETYLDYYGFDGDVENGLQRCIPIPNQNQEAYIPLSEIYKQAINQESSKLVASQPELMGIIEQGFGAQFLKRDRAFDGIFGLSADFDWAMGAALWKLEMEHEELRYTLENLQGTLTPQDKELRKRGEYAFRQGWYEEALKDLLISAEKNYLDFAVHLTIGNIYLFALRPVDHNQARDFFLRAGKYAAPRNQSPYHAALGYLLAGFVCYLQGDNNHALEYIQNAIDLAPDLNEAYYSQAKFAAASGNVAQAIASLEIAIRIDKKYAVKALVDQDFATIKKEMNSLLKRLHQERLEKFRKVWDAIQEEMSNYSITQEEQITLKPLQNKIGKLVEENTYFSYLKAENEAENFRELMVELRLAEREKIKREAEEIISNLLDEIEDYTIPNKLYQNLNRDITQANEALKAVETYQDSENALMLANACQRLWEIATDNKTTFSGHTNSIQFLQFTPNSRTLISCGWDHRVRLWDVSRGKERAIVMGQSGDARAIAISPDGLLLATEIYQQVQIHEIASGKRLVQMIPHPGQVRCIAFHPNGQFLIAGLDNKQIWIYNVKTGGLVDVLVGHSDWIMKIDISSDGKLLASGSRDKTIRIWTIEGLENLNPLSISPEEQVKVGGWAERKIGILAALNADFSMKYEANISSKPNENSQKFEKDPDTHTTHPRELAVLEGHENSIMDLSFSPDGTVLASASADRTIRLWDVENLAPITKLEGHTAIINCIAFSPDGSFLASAGDDNIVRLWDAEKAGIRFLLEGHMSGINSIAFNPDGTTLASASSDQTVRLWNVINGRLRSTVERHDSHVYSVTFSPDGATLASGGGDHDIHFWGMVVRKEAWQELVAEWTVLEEQEREDKIKMMRAARKLKRQQQKWRASGCCDICGKPLSLMEKINKHTKCKEHRKDQEIVIKNIPRTT